MRRPQGRGSKPRTKTGRYALGEVALERALSKLGIASRTVARGWIEAGRVSVNGKIVRDPLRAVVPERAKIEIAEVGKGEAKGARVEQAPWRLILLHKPRGVVTTRSDERGRPTVYSLLGDVDAYVAPVGRLDLATTGLLLLTNDTRLASWLTDPENEVPRVYLVTVRGELTDDEAQKAERGVRDEGELLQARRCEVRKSSGRESELVVELIEGKNREIRRLFAALGHEVTRLKRISYGGLELGDLDPGKWREITRAEAERAYPKAPFRR